MTRTERGKRLVRATLAVATAKRHVIKASMAQWRWVSNQTTRDLMQHTGPLFDDFMQLQAAMMDACATLDRLERERAALEGGRTP